MKQFRRKKKLYQNKLRKKKFPEISRTVEGCTSLQLVKPLLSVCVVQEFCCVVYVTGYNSLEAQRRMIVVSKKYRILSKII